MPLMTELRLASHRAYSEISPPDDSGISMWEAEGKATTNERTSWVTPCSYAIERPFSW
jgi:hypothetical protein